VLVLGRGGLLASGRPSEVLGREGLYAGAGVS